MTNNKSKQFSANEQEIALFAKVMSHPARIAIVKLLAEKNEIKTGSISDDLPIARSTVSQHLRELKELGIIKGTIDGLKIHYCLDPKKLEEIKKIFNTFFDQSITSFVCDCSK